MKRGNLLWVGSRMMLSEHRQLLNEKLKEEQEEYDVKYGREEQQLEEWQEIWSEAIINHQKISIIINKKERKQVTGVIVDWCLEEGIIYLQNKEGERKRIDIKGIVDLISDKFDN